MFIYTNNYELWSKQKRQLALFFRLLVNFPALSMTTWRPARGTAHPCGQWYSISIRTNGGTMVSTGKQKNLLLLPWHVIHQQICLSCGKMQYQWGDNFCAISFICITGLMRTGPCTVTSIDWSASVCCFSYELLNTAQGSMHNNIRRLSCLNNTCIMLTIQPRPHSDGLSCLCYGTNFLLLSRWGKKISLRN